MKTAKIGKHIVEYYDSIEDLPIVRFHKYNKMLLIDAGLGSDLTDFDAHIEKAVAFIQSGDKDNATNELNNLRKAVYFIQNGLSPKYLAFAALVSKVDGNETNDLSDDGLRSVVDTLADTTQKQAVSELDSAKKKIDEELRTYFPAMFDNADEKEFYNMLKARTVATLQNIIENKPQSEWQNVERLTRELLIFAKPPVFDGSESVEIVADKQFERMCLMIAQHLNVDARKYSVLAFYNAFEYLKEMLRKQRKN